MEITREQIELMSPAGSYESLMAAIQAGADSVYFGAGSLNMRSRSSLNFTLEDLKKVSGICHNNGVKAYLAVNTVIYDEEISDMKEIILAAKEADITAVIGSDIAVLDYCHQVGMHVHASTQLNISNTEAVKSFARYSNVMVLARELNLEQVAVIEKEIQRQNINGPDGNPVRIEIFVHGALCMSISGKCYLSLHEYGYSANRGACLQNCRRKYEVKDAETGHELLIDNEYIMSPKDLCTIGFLDKILESGAKVLKIEGRGRSPEYVKTVTKCYNEAIDAIINGAYDDKSVENWTKKLGTVFNRGFWDGYYLGRKIGEWTGTYGSSATQKKVYCGKITHYYSNLKVAVALIESETVEKGNDILIIGPSTGVYEGKLGEIRIDDIPVNEGKKGDLISFSVDSVVRLNDKLYKKLEAKRSK